MDWDVIAPMVVLVVGTLTAGGVLVLRPIATRLGALLEVMAREKATGAAEELRYLRDVVETTNQRLSLMEERLEFTERLIGRGEGQLTEAPKSRRSGTDETE